MKKIVLSVLVFGLMTAGSVYAQSGTAKGNKPATEKQTAKTEKKEVAKEKTTAKKEKSATKKEEKGAKGAAQKTGKQ
jgi:Ni/Co efflux regulator RcnB